MKLQRISKIFKELGQKLKDFTLFWALNQKCCGNIAFTETLWPFCAPIFLGGIFSPHNFPLKRHCPFVGPVVHLRSWRQAGHPYRKWQQKIHRWCYVFQIKPFSFPEPNLKFRFLSVIKNYIIYFDSGKFYIINFYLFEYQFKLSISITSST